MSKDCTGGYNSIFKTLGASNHTERESDKNTQNGKNLL